MLLSPAIMLVAQTSARPQHFGKNIQKASCTSSTKTDEPGKFGSLAGHVSILQGVGPYTADLGPLVGPQWLDAREQPAQEALLQQLDLQERVRPKPDTIAGVALCPVTC